MEEQIVLLMIAVSNGYGTSETCSSIWRTGEWCLRSAPSPPGMWAFTPLSLCGSSPAPGAVGQGDRWPSPMSLPRPFREPGEDVGGLAAPFSSSLPSRRQVLAATLPSLAFCPSTSLLFSFFQSKCLFFLKRNFRRHTFRFTEKLTRMTRSPSYFPPAFPRVNFRASAFAPFVLSPSPLPFLFLSASLPLPAFPSLPTSFLLPASLPSSLSLSPFLLSF